MNENSSDRMEKLMRSLIASGTIDLRKPDTVKALIRVPAELARESSARLAAQYNAARENGTEPGEPDEETNRLIAEEQTAVTVLFGLFTGTLTASVVPGWAGKPLCDWLAKHVPGNIYEKSPSFDGNTAEAACENLLFIYTNVYSKFAAFEQLMKRFSRPVDEADFEGMLDTFANLVSGASGSVALPEAFQHMDFSGEPVPENAGKLN